MNTPLLRVYNGIFEIDTEDPKAIFDQIATTNLFSYLRYAEKDASEALVFNVFYLKHPPAEFKDGLFSYEINLWRHDYNLHVDMRFHDDIEIREDSVYNYITTGEAPSIDELL